MRRFTMPKHISEFIPSSLSIMSKSRVPVTEADDLEIGIDYNGIAYEVLSENQIAPHINYDGSVNWESLESWAAQHNGTIVDREKEEINE